MGIRADRIKQLRESRGWTLQELGNKCGVSKGQAQRYEVGDSEPPADKLRLLAEIFNVTTDYLIGLVDNPTPICNASR
jgi:transcriptional regulator with XRE-family HTH domain